MGEKAAPGQGRDRVLQRHPQRSIRQPGRRVTLRRKEGTEGGDAERWAEVSPDGEGQPGGGRAARGPGPVVWLARWHKQSSKKCKNKDKVKVGPFHHEELYIYIFIYIIYYQPKLSGGGDGS